MKTVYLNSAFVSSTTQTSSALSYTLRESLNAACVALLKSVTNSANGGTPAGATVEAGVAEGNVVGLAEAMYGIFAVGLTDTAVFADALAVTEAAAVTVGNADGDAAGEEGCVQPAKNKPDANKRNNQRFKTMRKTPVG